MYSDMYQKLILWVFQCENFETSMALHFQIVIIQQMKETRFKREE